MTFHGVLASIIRMHRVTLRAARPEPSPYRMRSSTKHSYRNARFLNDAGYLCAFSPWTLHLFGPKFICVTPGGSCNDSQRDSKTGLPKRGSTLYDPRRGRRWRQDVGDLELP